MDKVTKITRGRYLFRELEICFYPDTRWEIVIEPKSRTVGPWAFARLKDAVAQIKKNEKYFRRIEAWK